MQLSPSTETLLQNEIDPAYALRARFIMEEVLKRNSRRVLDVGCGRGFYLKLLQEHTTCEELVGLDFKRENVLLAQELCASDARIKVEQGDAEHLPYGDARFDAVICSEVLEHLRDPKRALAEIFRVLTPGGILAVSVPHHNFPFLWDPLNFLLMSLANTHVPKDIHWLAGIWADHERLYSEEELLLSIREQRFEITRFEKVLDACLPFSHFLLYGIGKNLVERGLFSNCNRFASEKPGGLQKILAQIMRLPSRFAGNSRNPARSVNLCVAATKPT